MFVLVFGIRIACNYLIDFKLKNTAKIYVKYNKKIYTYSF